MTSSSVSKYHQRFKTLEQKFWEKVNKDTPCGCWEWTASLLSYGYGQFRVNKKIYKAHRISWVIHNGDIPDKLCVLHRCDNPPCVNPDHLFLGTNAENSKDMVIKGRSSHGGSHPNAALTRAKVIEIRMWLDLKYQLKSISKAYGTSMANISRIRLRKAWRHI